MRILLMLLVLVAAVWVLVVLVRAGRGAPVVETRVRAVLAEVRKIAWDHRDLDPELAGAVIARLRAFDRRPSPDILDDLLEVAWQHREESPHLSEILISTIRTGRGELE